MELGDFISELDSAVWWAGMAVRQGRHALEAILRGDPDNARLFASMAWDGLVLHHRVWVTMLLFWFGVVTTAFGILKGWGLWVLVPTLFIGWFFVALVIALWFNMLPLLLAAGVIWFFVCGAILTRRSKSGGEATTR